MTAVVFDVGETLVDEIANDVVADDIKPALAAGMVAVRIRRGPCGYLQEPPSGAIRIGALDDLPEALP